MSGRTLTDAEVLFIEGARCLDYGDDDRAEACFRFAIEMVPCLAEAHGNLALLMEKKGHADEAEEHYRKAIQFNPELSRIHLNYGSLLSGQKRFAEAEAAYFRGISLEPKSPVGWSNLGVLYACMKREAEAEKCYRTALSLDVDYTTARFNLSYILLRQGRFEEGWLSLEARNWYRALASRLSCPRWQGEPLAGKRLLIGVEAGFGDMIQFCRYADVLKEMGATSVGLICHAPLRDLFSTLAGVDQLITMEEDIPTTGWDLWTPLMSAPFHCKTRLNSIPAKIPYLRPPEGRSGRWLLPKNGLRVGLVWKGNPRFENDADRSLGSLSVLAPLWAIKGIHFASLQKGPAGEEAATPPDGLSLIDLGPCLHDFADTAAAIMDLDLIISVDTAVAHLAGALGKPCWVMLPEYMTDWRWMDNRAISPWYPGVMRLFRQTAMGDWASVVARIADALRGFAQETMPPLP